MILSERNKDNDFPPTWLLIVMSGIALMLVIFLILTLYQFKMRIEPYQPVQPPDLILNFLEEITAEDANLDNVLSVYFLNNKLKEDENISPLRSKLAFDYILHPGGDKSYGYSLEYSGENYVEFAILDEDGNKIYPLVVMGYKLNEFGNKIEDYSIGRLQPFSRRNPEYDKRWSQ